MGIGCRGHSRRETIIVDEKKTLCVVICAKEEKKERAFLRLQHGEGKFKLDLLNMRFELTDHLVLFLP